FLGSALGEVSKKVLQKRKLCPWVLELWPGAGAVARCWSCGQVLNQTQSLPAHLLCFSSGSSWVRPPALVRLRNCTCPGFGTLVLCAAWVFSTVPHGCLVLCAAWVFVLRPDLYS